LPVLDKLIKSGKLQIKSLRENLLINEFSRQSDQMLWKFSIIRSEYYVLTMKQNQKRSLNHRRKEGKVSGNVPLDYINCTNEITKQSTVRLDSDRAILIKRIFEMYATGKLLAINTTENHTNSIPEKKKSNSNSNI